MATYYVSPAGSDANPGTSTGAPWQTLAKVQQVHDANGFSPGDSILLQGGQTFAAPSAAGLVWTTDGTSGARITIGSYGTGRATITAGTGSGIEIRSSWTTVQDLVAVGSGRATNRGCGFLARNLTGLARRPGLEFKRLDAHGFGGAQRCTGTGIDSEGCGIYVGVTRCGSGAYGWTGPLLEDCIAYDNTFAGIMVQGPSSSQRIHDTVTLRRCRAYDNPGSTDPADGPTGNGILLEFVDGGLVEQCVAYGNGALCTAGAGPVGIWGWGLRRVVFRSCLSYDNTTGNVDGGGFDLDSGCEECLIEYCLTSRNQGPGYMLFNFPGSPMDWCRNNVVRFCISVDDGQTKEMANRVTSYGTAAEPSNNLFYGCTFVHSGGPAKPLLKIEESVNTRVWNNIFISLDGSRIVDGVSAGALDFRGNRVHRAGGSPTFQWNGTTYTSLIAFQSAVGGSGNSEGDPQLTGQGTVPTPASAETLHEIAAYRLPTGSPLPTAGIDLDAALAAVSGLAWLGGRGTRDFFGDALPSDARHVGADASAVASAIVYDLEHRAGTSGSFAALATGLSSTSHLWETAGIPNGTRQVRVRARDLADGASSAWATRTLTVQHAVIEPPPAGTFLAIDGVVYQVMALAPSEEPEYATTAEVLRAEDGTLLTGGVGTITARAAWRATLYLTPAEADTLSAALANRRRVVAGGDFVGGTAVCVGTIESAQIRDVRVIGGGREYRVRAVVRLEAI